LSRNRSAPPQQGASIGKDTPSSSEDNEEVSLPLPLNRRSIGVAAHRANVKKGRYLTGGIGIPAPYDMPVMPTGWFVIESPNAEHAYTIIVHCLHAQH